MKTDTRFRPWFAPLLLAAIASTAVAAPAPGNDPVPGALQPFVDDHRLAGAVTLVADKDRVLALDAVGYSDVSANRPMKTDALFWIASQSNPITATALMMLVDEGKVKLDEPVTTYLPEFRDLWVAVERDNEHLLLKRPAHPITVREILCHTSGLPFASAMEQPTLDALTLKDAVRSYAMTPLQFEPGTKYQYSNAGINTAGRIIEVVSGMPYETFLQKRLFEPLGMKDTTFWPNKEQLSRLAKSYKPSADKNGLEETTVGQLTYPLDDPGRKPMPAGGLFSTADDLERFCRMILNRGVFEENRLLSESAISEMTKKQTGDRLKDNYGLGWSTDGATFGHGGAFSTDFSIDSPRGRITIFLVQHAGFPRDGGKSRDAFRQAAERLFENSGGPKAAEGKTIVLFDGKTLEGWTRADFFHAGEVRVEDGAIVMDVGGRMTGITTTRKDLPTMNYELTYEANRLSGRDFFGAATFPVGKSFLTFVNGGWGGHVTGLSSLNGADASENETGRSYSYKDKTWYRFRIHVTEDVVRCWIDDKVVVTAHLEGRKVGTRVEVNANKPLGFATFETKGAVRKIEVRPLTPAEIEANNKAE